VTTATATAQAPRWYEGRLCGFDLETTSADPCEARIVQACVVHAGNGEATDSRTWLVNPGVEVPEEAAAIHGITTERVRAEGMDARSAVLTIAGELRATTLCGEPIVIMNAAYDLTVLDRELRRYALPLLDVAVVLDPFVLDRHLDPYRKGRRNLAALCQHYNAKIDGPHDAAADAIAATRIAWRIARKYPEIGEADPATLHSQQIRWYAEQAAHLEDHFRKTDARAVCNREWPLRSYP
jgi:DNA polymerase III epsilon subunit-like protein